MCGAELEKELQLPVSRQQQSMEESLLWCEVAFANCNVFHLHLVKGKLNQIGYHRIQQHHVSPSGTWIVDQGFVIMQDNDPKHIVNSARSTLKRILTGLNLEIFSPRPVAKLSLKSPVCSTIYL